MRLTALLFSLLIAHIGIMAGTPDKVSLANAVAPAGSYDLYNVVNTISSRPLKAIEGVWHLTDDDEGVITILADQRTNAYLLIVTNSPNRLIAPGTIMGIATQSAQKDVFDALIYTSTDKSSLTKPKPFTLRLSDKGYLRIEDASTRILINYWRMLPYMFRFSAKRENRRPDNLDGAYRLYPAPDTPLFGPIIL